MHQRGGKAGLAVIIFLIAGTALAQTKTVEEIVARVNGDIILKSELDRAKERLRAELATPAPRGQGLQGAQLEQVFAEQSKNALRDLIDQTLLLQRAKEMDLNADLEVVKTMERMRLEYNIPTTEQLEQEITKQLGNLDEFKQEVRTRYLTGQVLGREVYGKVVVTNEELRKYYEENSKNFDRPEGMRVREIVVSTKDRGPEEIESQKKKAEEAVAAIKKGDDFAEVARKYSESQTAQDGGDLGFFAKGELAKPLEDAVTNLDKGQTTDLLTVPDGFIILKLEDKHNGGVLPFELAQKEITDILFQQHAQPKIREYLSKLRSEGFIEVREGNTDTGTPSKTEKVSEVAPRR
ncbi:MAG: hypothetical protein DMG13_19625 [Acidobacteria bacterium]|nr:MAG: hypothetical protein DMG13_19625 [Acidobacteriota bacterium]